MLKVLLVEDEFIVRKGIETILKAQTHVPLDLCSVPDAVDAQEAAQRMRPDVVITDINMPEISGFELIESLIEQHLCERFIVITGYENIQFTYRALHLGVLDYLVKPIDKQQLLRRLAEVQQDKARALRDAALHLKHRLLGAVWDVDLPDTSELDILFPHRWLVFAALVPRHGELDETEPSAIQGALQQFFPVTVPLQICRQFAFALNFDDDITQRDAERAIRDAIGDTDIYWMGCSAPAHTGRSSDPYTLYITALAGAALDMIDPPAHTRELLEQHQPDGVGFLQAAKKGDIQAWVKQALDAPSLAQQPDPYNAVGWLCAMEICLNLLTEWGGTQHIELLLQRWLKQLGGVSNAAGLVAHLRTLLNQFQPHLYLDPPEQCYPEKIRLALEYIQHNYQRDLSLGDIADAIELQSAYVSHLFKKTVGSSFLQVLHRARIDAACTLLRTQRDLPIDEVAKRVGYQTPTYFFRIFKTHMDMSPGEYRDQ